MRNFSFFVLLCSSETYASFPLTDSPTAWMCTARGVDEQSQYSFSFGDYRPTREEAESSALQICQIQGYRECEIVQCQQDKI